MKPKPKQLNVNVPPAQFKGLQKLSALTRISQSDLLREALADLLRKYEEAGK